MMHLEAHQNIGLITINYVIKKNWSLGHALSFSQLNQGEKSFGSTKMSWCISLINFQHFNCIKLKKMTFSVI